MSEYNLSVHTVIDNNKTIFVPFNASTTAEDVCIFVCKQLNIGNITRHLFALRVTGKQIFLKPSATFEKKCLNYDFRVRFKVANITKLRRTDIRAYDYYFLQAKNDILENKIPDIEYEKYKRELLGLGITDMYRVMLEKDIPRQSIENEYKKYIPKEVIKRHQFFIKKPIHDTLATLSKSLHNVSFVKAEYIRQLDIIAPEYLYEVFKAVVDEEGSISNILIKVSPYHATMPGILYCYESKKDQWKHICTIGELGFISIRDDGTVEISRKNGIPFYMKFNSISLMLSFISLLDGYYRLTCKWTFNICKEVPTPSLQKLYYMKCHGPVGGEFSYAKLEEKRSNRPGTFILRESESKYNHYYLDVCMKDSSKPKTFKLEKISEDDFIFNDDLTRYQNIHQLVSAYSDPNGPIFLLECLPPSEYDISPLLLCLEENLSNLDSYMNDPYGSNLVCSVPLCINWKDLQVYKGNRKEGSRGITIVYRSMWKVGKGKKIEVAMKMLKQDDNTEKYLKDFLDLAGRWAFLQSNAIVKLFGFTMSSNVSMVLEYFRLGPLDQYLMDNKGIMKTVDLIEASSNLASALWHLKECGIVHGKIRCRKLLVSTHDDNSFTVKLSDPGIQNSYSPTEIHWIPIECYKNLEYAKRSAAADVWAFATTVYEIFTFGKEIKNFDWCQLMQWYSSGKRLPKPQNCPSDIYALMMECWETDPARRKQTQAIMRDIKQIMYQVYNSRRTHSYAKVFHKHALREVPGTSTTSLHSNVTDTTCLGTQDDLISASELSKSISSDMMSFDSQNWLSNSQILVNEDASSFSNMMSMFNFSTATTSLASINSLESIFELDDEWNIILQGRIGQGFYGEVFKGTMEHIGNAVEPRKVAIKKLKTADCEPGCIQDFEREINIMKSLKHPNIVEILGVLRDPDVALVMEFIHHGSLQSYLKINRESLQIKQLLKYALDIAMGMDYLGTKNIVHRDLAARNILVVDETHVKISDFGLAQVMGTNDYYILKTNRDLPIKWYAPESLIEGKFSRRSDVWSYGVTMTETFNYGEEPDLAKTYEDDLKEGQENQVLFKALESGARFPCPPMCPQAVYIRIIYPCWQNDPHNRPTFADLVSETKDLLANY